jgi:hypothetical protein
MLLLITVEPNGSVPEWLMGVDCKSTGYAYTSSNLVRPIHSSLYSVSCLQFLEPRQPSWPNCKKLCRISELR